MKTVEELEAQLETVTRERDELRAIIGAGGLTYSEGETSMRTRIAELAQVAESAMRERDLSLSAWESAGMQGRTAQSAMLELARQLDESRDTIVALTTAMAEKDLEIATLTAALDERDVEAERGLEQYESLVHQLADATNESTHFQVMCKRETEEVERLQVACHAWAEDMREAGRLCEQAGNEMPIDAVRRFVSSKTAIVDMLQDRLSESRAEVERWRTSYDAASSHAVDVRAMLDQVRKELYEARSEVDRLTDERDELIVRVANQDAELRATREAYRDAFRRGAEAMREACATMVLTSMSWRTRPDEPMADEIAERVRTLPIPEEP